MPVRVVVGMSGGVDSSVAAARLLTAGFEVVGATLRLWNPPGARADDENHASLRFVQRARAVAEQLGVPHHVVDWRDQFEPEIITRFVEAYLRGQTPSPCVGCNRHIKLPALSALAAQVGAEYVATGHYARVDRKGPRPRLLRGVDRSRDQSYFLQLLPAEVLQRLMLPLGESTKAEVRAEASRLGLPVAGERDSQELCFIPDGGHVRFVAERAGHRLRHGRIVDAAGREVGRHRGIHAFTIGQRKNLGVALGRRAYVVSLDAATGTVGLGEREDLLSAGAVLVGARLDADVQLPVRCDAVVRYRSQPVRAQVCVGAPSELRLSFDEPVRAVVPGQFVGLYSGDQVLGGGMIASAIPSGRGREVP